MAYSMVVDISKNTFQTKKQWEDYCYLLEEDRLKCQGTCVKDIPWWKNHEK